MCMFACKGDWNKGLVPNDFFQNLFTHYWDYFEDGQNIKNGRQACYDAFLYFADRILPSINAEVTKYHGEKKCLVRMSNVFSITDEAYALLMVENYYERWVSLSKKNNSNDEGGEGVTICNYLSFSLSSNAMVLVRRPVYASREARVISRLIQF